MQQATVTDSYYQFGSTIRAVPPEHTYARLQPLLKTFGITRVANITGLDRIGIPVATAIRPNSKHLSVAQGKGSTLLLAQISAIMEAIESYHLENPDEPELIGSYQQLSVHHPIISPQQFAHNPLTRTDLTTHPITWARGVNLINGQDMLVPHQLTSMDTTQTHPDKAWLSVTSNGVAAGNTLDEAILHALYEVLERDALAKWHRLSHAKQLQTQLNIATINEPNCQQLMNKIQNAGFLVTLWHLTAIASIPTFYCIIHDSSATTDCEFVGSGTHLNKSVALMRAITEAAQMRLTLINGSRDDIFPIYYQCAMQYDTTTPSNGKLNFNTCPTPKYTKTFAKNKQQIIDALQLQGISHVILINHTKFDIPVVQIIIPGLLNDESC